MVLSSTLRRISPEDENAPEKLSWSTMETAPFENTQNALAINECWRTLYPKQSPALIIKPHLTLFNTAQFRTTQKNRKCYFLSG
jgi:hypothetical protein